MSIHHDDEEEEEEEQKSKSKRRSEQQNMCWLTSASCETRAASASAAFDLIDFDFCPVSPTNKLPALSTKAGLIHSLLQKYGQPVYIPVKNSYLILQNLSQLASNGQSLKGATEADLELAAE